MHTARDARKVCSRIGFAFAAMLVMVLCAQFMLSLLALRFAPWFVHNETGYWLLADASIYLCGAPVFLLILHTIPDGHESERETLRMTPLRYLLVLVVCLGVAYAASFVTNFFLVFVEMVKNSPVQIPDVLTESSFPVSLFFGAVVPGLGEEFLFRYMLRKKLRGAGDKVFILVSALCFAVFHMNMAQLVFTFFVGAIFAWIYTQTGSIWYSVSLHFLFNSVALLLGQIQEELFGVLVAYVGIMFVFIAVSLTTLVLSMRYIRTHLRPPEEPGWPYKPPPAKYAAGMAGYRPAGSWQGNTPYSYGMPPQHAHAAYTPPYAAHGMYAPPQAYSVPQAQYVPPMQGYQPPVQGYGAPTGAPAYGYGAQPPVYILSGQGHLQGQYGMPPQMSQPPQYGYPGGYPGAYPGAPVSPVNQPPYAGAQQSAYGYTVGNHNINNYQSYNNYNDNSNVYEINQQPLPVKDCPELTHAAYNNMPQNQTPPAYQNMRPVWPQGDPRAANAAQAAAVYGQPALGPAAMPPLFGQGHSSSIFKTCFLNPGMVVYLVGGFLVILLSLLF